MANINSKYEVWKKKLLDMGKRNRLLNYKNNGLSTINITTPKCYELYKMFVTDETPLVFPMIKEESEEQCENGNVETNKPIPELQKSLRLLRNKAKTAVEEQGVNVLYLAFGFLNWKESEHSKYYFASPLILVPVTLTIESIASPYKLVLHEDEIILNPTLVYKLENDFGVTLPEFVDEDDISNYFEKVKNSLTIKDWSVSEDVGLSLFSFLKINMYSDLDKHKESIISNPIIKTIGGDVSAIEEIPYDLVNSDFDYDKEMKPTDFYQVVDADSSQQDAILMAKKGVSFILQGPPGTGKSQTITNIIAECLADGKKILFVSEKMAALEVVYKRLSNAGLNDFCLVLHSYKANKRNVLEQLSNVLKLSEKKITLSDEAYQKLDSLQRDKSLLNEYANQLHSIIEPLGKTIFEANGIVANLETYNDLIFSIENIKDISKEQYNKYIYLLSRMATIMGKMTNDYKSNPWYGCTLKTVTNEFRHDATSRINSLIPKIKDLDELFAQSCINLHLDSEHTIEEIDNIISILDCAENAYPIPAEWILSDEIQSLFDEVKDCLNLKNDLIKLKETLTNEYDFIINNSDITLSTVNSLNNVDILQKENEILKNSLSNDIYTTWKNEDIENISKLLSDAIETANTINTAKNNLLKVYEPSVFELDYKGILSRIKTDYTSFAKIFNKQYKEDKKSIQLCHREIVKKISDDEMLFLVEKLRDIDEIRKWYVTNEGLFKKYFNADAVSEDSDYSIYEKQLSVYASINKSTNIIDNMIEMFNNVDDKETVLKEHYKFLYNGLMSDWESIQNALNWAILFKESVSNVNVSEQFIKSVCQGKDFIDICKNEKLKLIDQKRNISFEYNWFISYFDDDFKNTLEKTNLAILYDRLNSCVNGFSLLEEWIDYRSAMEECVSSGLKDYIDIIIENDIPVSDIIPIFKKRFFRLWLDAVIPDFPAVMNFRRKMQEMTIDEFSSLDRTQFEIAKARIRSQLINNLPSLEHFTNGVDEISILKKELSKQRCIMPVRRLFKAIPNLLLTLKPCLMMSPLSVSLFLEAETYKFDIVIFDEASQVCTENAIGAISRAKQVIIAGDSKQLPPTNFFQAAISENDFDDTTEDEEFDDSNAYESILDEANMLPERTLKWHYRSKHESLIAFSNAKIYNNNLITFPSNIESVANHGVEYVYVPDGFYDRGGKKGNIIEANKIADLVFEHFEKTPTRSLGVIAFGEVQQQAIETVIREKRLKNQKYEPFFSEDKDEAFFVKNLENVQGDERDTIIFSIGYAKDSTGVFRMNFGPLSKSGGERRLNVAITRAKYNIKLVGSIMPTDINIDKVSTEGPKLLRSYIDFAINGSSVLEREITESDVVEHDSPFEEAVYKFLERRGYKLGTQIGCSGYRIDMAVKHPTISGIYVLGIECDGATYHSARTARERDRLRQDVLENMGWKIYRIWSTDWIKDPVTEGEKLIEAIENAISEYGIDTDLESTFKAGDEDITVSDFENVQIKEISENTIYEQYGFTQFETTSFSSLPKNSNGYLEVTDCIMQVINTEYPVHYDILCQRMAPLYGNEKATIKIRREVDYGLSKLTDKYLRKGDFLFPTNYTDIPIRMPNERKIQHISTDEIATAMISILKTCVGTTKESLCTETAKVYGFNRIGQNIMNAMDLAYNFLISDDKIEEIDGKVKIKN